MNSAPMELAHPAVSVVLPVYNEAGNLDELLRRIKESVGQFGEFEIIVVDDGSTDSSWALIETASRADSRVVGVRLQRNFGQHPAVTAGFARARGDVVVTLDSDLQNPPEEIPKLISRLGPDCDVASGWRQVRNDSVLRTLPSKLTNVMIARVTGVRLNDYGCMLRAYKREVIDQLALCPETNRMITALVSWLGVRIVEVPVDHHPRKAGRSRYSFWRLIRMSFDIMTGFSTDLLQFVSLAGIALSFIGLAAAVVLVVWRLVNGSGALGLTTFLALLFFLSGAQMAAIGVVGEYVGRIYTQAQGRPYYLVRTEVGEGLPVGEATS